MKRSAPIRKRRPTKRKAPGTRCYGSAKCRRNALDTYDGKRYCDVHLADAMTRTYVLARDGECVRCGVLGPLQWCHVVTRRYKSVRWSVGERISDPWNNSVAMCPPCHAWQTHNPLEGDELFRSLGIDLVNLRYLAMHDEPADPLAVIEERGGLAGKEK